MTRNLKFNIEKAIDLETGYLSDISALSTYYCLPRFGDRSDRWVAYGRRELRFPTLPNPSIIT